MLLRDLLRTSSFRLSASFAASFSLSALLLFAFIYWQTAVVERKRAENGLAHDLHSLAEGNPADVERILRLRLGHDLHRVTYASLFTADGRPVVGNLEHPPPGVPADGRVHRVDLFTEQADGAPARELVLVVSRRLADGRMLVIGQSIDSLDNLHTVVLRALIQGVAPAVLLSLLVGAVLGRRTLRQIRAVHQATERIMHGNLRERLPLSGGGDEFDRLATSVNHLLEEIERLVDEAKSTGDNIAHDLRTPLTRVRSRLERARQTAHSHAELQDMVDDAIGGLDQTLRIITALLRIGQIEGGQRYAAFSPLDLTILVAEMGDLFEPFAEEKGIRFAVEAARTDPVLGDRDLLSEAIANLLDNALKFTPAGGRVRLVAGRVAGRSVVRVVDSGPGIPPEEREAVMRRFYRSDKSRHVEGCGLGLSLVDAIIRLHGFRLSIGDAHPGCIFEIVCVSSSQ